MGLFSKLGDAAVEGVTKSETIRISYDALSKIVIDAFVIGADDAFMTKVLKTAKGGFAIPKEMKSKNGRYDFHVGARPNGCVWLSSKPVWVFDRDANKFYQLDKDLRWKKFYKTIQSAIKSEKINRNK